MYYLADNYVLEQLLQCIYCKYPFYMILAGYDITLEQFRRKILQSCFIFTAHEHSIYVVQYLAGKINVR